MFLRATKRFKDGKAHYCWSLVESVRVGRRVFLRQALYLGELNGSQRAEWQRTVEAFDENGKPQQMKLFPEDRTPGTGDDSVVRIRTDRLAVKNLRNWGGVWLGTVLWDRLGLDDFWKARLSSSRKGTDWLSIMKAIVLYMFTDPGSELRMHSNWMANTAVEELIGPGALTGRSTLYSCLDRVIWPSDEWRKPRAERRNSFKDELFYYLRDRWAGLFGSTCDAILFDLTSTSRSTERRRSTANSGVTATAATNAATVFRSWSLSSLHPTDSPSPTRSCPATRTTAKLRCRSSRGSRRNTAGSAASG